MIIQQEYDRYSCLGMSNRYVGYQPTVQLETCDFHWDAFHLEVFLNLLQLLLRAGRPEISVFDFNWPLSVIQHYVNKAEKANATVHT
jgi:hypothetical protein